LPAKAPSLALRSVLPRVLLPIAPDYTSFALIEGIKKAPTEAAFTRSASAGAYQASTPGSRRAAVVSTNSARTLVTLCVQPIVRESPRECKPFCITSGSAPSSSRGPRARCTSASRQSWPGRGVPACQAGQPRYIALRDAAPLCHATRSAACSVGLGTAAP
jgi:hypothetical protein